MKKIMMCIDLKNESVDLFLKDIKKTDWKDINEVHFVHGFQLQYYADTFYFTSYPLESQYAEIEQSVMQVLRPLEDAVKDLNSEVKSFTKCMIASSPKESLIDYAKKNAINSMVIGTRGKHGIEGLFSSSFAEYMVRHAHCELRIIRES